MMSSKKEITDKHIEEIIRDELGKKYPEHAGAIEEIMGSAVQSARNRIIRVRSSIPAANPDNLISFSLESMIKQREKELAYEDYCKFIEEQEGEAIELEEFKKESAGNQSTYYFFLQILQMGIKTGDQVVNRDGKVYTVTKITNKCRPILVDENGKKKGNQNLLGFEKFSG